MPEAAEPILEPALPIVDPHHHLWDRRRGDPSSRQAMDRVLAMQPRYLLDELLADLSSGHHVRATVYVEWGAMYRADGPAHLKPLGETEFANGVGAMSASGLYGDVRACAGIVGNVNLRRDEAEVVEALERHLQAAPDRFRGIRVGAGWDADVRVLGSRRSNPQVYLAPDFRRGFAHLRRLGLSFDAWLLEPQIPELTDLADAFPETTIVLDHVGAPLGVASYEGRREERFPIWRQSMLDLAQRPNVVVKVGGLGMPLGAFPSLLADPPATSEQLAADWRPYVETVIEAFGPDRCMFESNFPVDRGSGVYALVWNAFKRLAQGASADEKAALFSGTARRVYRLELP
ncbi:MAG: amidohydrolase family protein [Phenylobacterium sp.]